MEQNIVWILPEKLAISISIFISSKSILSEH